MYECLEKPLFKVHSSLETPLLRVATEDDNSKETEGQRANCKQDVDVGSSAVHSSKPDNKCDR